MISVVMATYNSEKYLKKQLDSIVNQSVLVDEVIIVDDCSTDNTVELLKDYIESNKSRNWKLYYHKSNMGYIRTFKEGLSYSNGDVIITCDHDDIWMPNKVELIKNTIENNSEILYLATSFIQIDENDKEVCVKNKINRSNNNLIRRKVKKNSLNKMHVKDVAIYNISPGCTCALTNTLRDMYLNMENCESLPHDWSLALIAACKKGLYYLDLPTTKYRIHSNNTIGLGHTKSFEKRLSTVKINLSEKKIESNIYMKYKNDEELVMYFVDIINIFEKRVAFLEQPSIVKAILLLKKCVGFGTLYESVLYDIYCVMAK